jgi:Transcription factor WhiB
MQVVYGLSVCTPEDEVRARKIRESEAEPHPRAPEFMRNGLGPCLDATDPNIFTNISKRYHSDYAQRAEAAEFCEDCPFRAECLTWGVEAGESGTFGGEFLIRGVLQKKAWRGQRAA